MVLRPYARSHICFFIQSDAPAPPICRPLDLGLPYRLWPVLLECLCRLRSNSVWCPAIRTTGFEEQVSP